MATPLATISPVDRLRGQRHEHRRPSGTTPRYIGDGSARLIGSLVARRALQTPNEIAFSDMTSGESTTWSAVAKRAQQWDQMFPANLDGGRNSLLVGIVTGSGWRYCEEVLAALAAGVPVAPLDAELPSAELLWAGATLGLTHLVMSGEEPIELRNFRLGRGGLDAYEQAREDAPAMGPTGSRARSGKAVHPSSPDSADAMPGVVLRTRGRSGPPKLVPLTTGQVFTAGRQLAEYFRLQESDRGLVVGPLDRADRIAAVIAILLSGGSLVAASSSKEITWAAIDSCEATWLSVDAEHIDPLAATSHLAGTVAGRVRVVAVGAEALGLADHSAFWQQTGIPVIEMYTLTEAAGLVTANTVATQSRRPGSVGRPLGVEVRIVDDFGNPMIPHATGRVQVRGRTVAKHYLSYGRDLSVIPATDKDGWLTTGDIGRMGRDGALYVVGPEPVERRS